MVAIILIFHAIYGGCFGYIVTNTYEAIHNYIVQRNWLYTGIYTHYDYLTVWRKMVSWLLVSLSYIIGYIAIIYISLNLI